MVDILIIGAGAAGVSAALYTLRAGKSTVIINNGTSSLLKAHMVENYYGTESIKGKDLHERGLNQAIKLGAKIVDDEVYGIYFSDNMEDYIVKCNNSEYKAKKILIATGASRNKPKILNLDKYEGSGVSYCASCDGFFYRKKDVVVVGDGNYALHEAEELKNICSSVTICTNGNKMSADKQSDIKIIDKKIKSLYGEGALEGIYFEDESKLSASGLFIAMGAASAVDMANKLGILTESNSIIVNERMQTNIANVYAAGDCTGGKMQIAKAVYEGMVAATEMIK